MKVSKYPGFIKVAAAIPEVKVADCRFNAERIIGLINKAALEKVQIVCFPELSISGYTCGDLFHQQLLLDASWNAIEFIKDGTNTLDIVSIIGAPIRQDGKLFNAAIVVCKGKIMGIVPKMHLPNRNEFYEKRWFSPAIKATSEFVKEIPFGTNLLFGTPQVSFSIEICEDLWTVIPPSSIHSQQGATIIFNLSASNELIRKNTYRKQLIQQQSARCIAGYVYSSSGWGESTTDTVYSGNAYICENGNMLAESKRFLFEEQLIISEIDTDKILAERQRNNFSATIEYFEKPYKLIPINLLEEGVQTLTRKINPHPFIPPTALNEESCDEILSIQIGGISKRLNHTQIKNLVLGISGGLDSTLALFVCAKAFDKLGIDRKNIIGVTMPGLGTTERTRNNAIRLMQSLGITFREINISAACMQHFKDIGHDPSVHDITFENTQARERTQVLMDIANQVNGLLIGTGNMSEAALGWSTYNGDHMSMYAVNSGIPKTLVRHLVDQIAQSQLNESSRETLKDILYTPVSPELLPTESGEIKQKTEAIVGPYELHDFFLYYAIRYGFKPDKILSLAEIAFKETYSEQLILKWMKVFFRRFFSQQFKRSCVPDGVKVGSVNLSPRGDWRMPSDASASLWLEQIEILEKRIENTLEKTSLSG